MSGHIVYQGVPHTHDDDDDDNTQPRAPLFAGQRLWFSHVIPQRKQMIQNARLNGAVIVDRDTDADVRLVDHLRKNNAPGTYSYRYVELSLRNGQLENLADHAVGAPSRVSRPVGSTVTAPKSGRTPFTPEDDQFLWDWMKPFIDRGGAWKGNEIYKQMEVANPRHTFQSWRDRWIKHTQFQERHITEAVAAQNPPMDNPATQASSALQKKKRRRELHDDGEEQRAKPEGESYRPTTAATGAVTDRLPEAVPPHEEVQPAAIPQYDSRRAFTQEEYDELYELAATYVGWHFDDFDTPWEQLAKQRGTHTAAEWKHFFTSSVIPDYCNNNRLPLSEVAPYLSEKPEEQAINASKPFSSREDDQATPVTSETEEDYQCTNCFTVETTKWRHHKGKLICYECVKFVRSHGYHRPSTTRSIDESAVNTDENVQPRINETSPPITNAQNDSGAQIILPQDSSLSGAGKQNPLLTTEGASPPTPPGRDYSQQTPRLTSPSFQPDPSTTSRAPGPNESRKRRAGGGTQSQSTKESSRAATEGQPLDNSLPGDSQSQTEPSQGLAAEMGETQSKESDAQLKHSSLTNRDRSSKAAAAFPDSPQGKRKRPLDGLGKRTVQQHPSIDTGNTEHGPPRTLPIIDSRWDDELSHLTTPSNPSKRVRTHRNISPLFVQKYNDNNEEEHKRDVESELNPDTDSSSSVASHHHQPSEQFETAQESVQEYETGLEEQPRAFNQTRTTQVLSNQFQEVEEELDLALELPEPPASFDSVGVNLSATPYDGNISENAAKLRKVGQYYHSQNSLEVEINTEDDGFLEQPSFLPLVPTSGLSPESDDVETPTGNAKGKEKQVQEQSNEQGQTAKGSSPEPDGHETDDWIALQRSLHPRVQDLEPVLFKAIESTSFDFGLASEVVDIMLANRRRFMDEQRRQSRRSGVGRSTVPAEADLDMESLLPQAMRGVWTEMDDSLLLSPDASDMNTVLKKHGRAICDTRFVFLAHFVEG